MKKLIHEITGNIFTLADEMFPLYLVRGEKSALVDCSILARFRRIDEALDLCLQGKRLDYVLLTHSHYDHTGACSVLQKKHGFSIICSHRTKEILQNPDAIRFIDDLNQKFKKMLAESSESVFTQPERITAVREGDTIDIGDSLSFRVYETPGHTRCSISFMLLPQRILFCGDAAGVVETSGKIKPLFLSSYIQYESSQKKLQALDAEILALPHNQYIRGRKRVGKFLQQALDETGRVKELILHRLKEDQPIERIGEELLAQEFPDATVMGPREALLINVMAMARAVQREFLPPRP